MNPTAQFGILFLFMSLVMKSQRAYSDHVPIPYDYVHNRDPCAPQCIKGACLLIAPPAECMSGYKTTRHWGYYPIFFPTTKKPMKNSEARRENWDGIDINIKFKNKHK